MLHNFELRGITMLRSGLTGATPYGPGSDNLDVREAAGLGGLCLQHSLVTWIHRLLSGDIPPHLLDLLPFKLRI